MTHSNTLLPFIVENGDQISILSHYLGVGEGIGRRASVCIGARFRVHRGALRYASRRASVRVEARFRYASRRAAGTRRAQKAYESEFKTWKRRASGALFRPGGWRVEGGRVSFDVVEQKMKWMQVSEKNPNPFQVPTLFLSWTPLALLCFPVVAVQVLLSPFSPHFVFILSLSLSLPLFIFFPFMNYNINVTYF